MSTLSKHLTEGLGASVSLVGAITAWQTEVEFWLRIIATLVAITAGCVTIWSTLKRRKERP